MSYMPNGKTLFMDAAKDTHQLFGSDHGFLEKCLRVAPAQSFAEFMGSLSLRYKVKISTASPDGWTAQMFAALHNGDATFVNIIETMLEQEDPHKDNAIYQLSKFSLCFSCGMCALMVISVMFVKGFCAEQTPIARHAIMALLLIAFNYLTLYGEAIVLAAMQNIMAPWSLVKCLWVIFSTPWNTTSTCLYCPLLIMFVCWLFFAIYDLKKVIGWNSSHSFLSRMRLVSHRRIRLATPGSVCLKLTPKRMKLVTML